MLYMVQKFIEKDQPKGCLAFFAPNENIGMHYQCWIHQQSKKNCNWCSIEVLSTINRVCHPISCSKRHSSTLTTLFMGGNPCPIIRLITRLTALATGHIREDLAIGQWGSPRNPFWVVETPFMVAVLRLQALFLLPCGNEFGEISFQKFGKRLPGNSALIAFHHIPSKKKVLEGSSREVPRSTLKRYFFSLQCVLPHSTPINRCTVLGGWKFHQPHFFCW